MKKIALLAFALSLFILGCASPSNTNEAFQVSIWSGGGFTPNPTYDSITLFSNGTLEREHMYLGNRTRRSIQLNSSELSEFKNLVLSANILSLKDSYSCYDEQNTPCPTDLPTTRLDFELNKSNKSILIYHPSELPQSLTEVLNKFYYYKRTLGGELGDFCGGIAAFQCASGLQCILDGDYPDAGGTCQESACKDACNTTLRILYVKSNEFAQGQIYENLSIFPNGTLEFEFLDGKSIISKSRNLNPDELYRLESSFSDASILALNRTHDCGQECFPWLPNTYLNITSKGIVKYIFINRSAPIPGSLLSVLSVLDALKTSFGAEEGGFCGGPNAIQCKGGLRCELTGTYLDSRGTCVP